MGFRLHPQGVRSMCLMSRASNLTRWLRGDHGAGLAAGKVLSSRSVLSHSRMLMRIAVRAMRRLRPLRRLDRVVGSVLLWPLIRVMRVAGMLIS